MRERTSGQNQNEGDAEEAFRKRPGVFCWAVKVRLKGCKNQVGEQYLEDETIKTLFCYFLATPRNSSNYCIPEVCMESAESESFVSTSEVELQCSHYFLRIEDVICEVQFRAPSTFV